MLDWACQELRLLPAGLLLLSMCAVLAVMQVDVTGWE
jgi:hypothetical protein